MTIIQETNLPNMLHRGKVRDTYGLDGGLLLMVATDRISAFDVILPSAIPDKGAVLSQLSAFWFEKTSHIVSHHLVDLAFNRKDLSLSDEIARRSMVVRKAQRIDVECIVRGYITGSAWAEYRKNGTVSGQTISSGLTEGDKFPEPLFTPTTKADEGHDENLTYQQVEDMVGADQALKLADISKAVYNFAHDLAKSKGIIIADTKMEFGIIDGKLSLIDELLTPDSSRFWDAEHYSPGNSLPNYDKQFVRDWLDANGWDHEPPAPELPQDVIDKTAQRYLQAYKKLTNRNIV